MTKNVMKVTAVGDTGEHKCECEHGGCLHDDIKRRQIMTRQECEETVNRPGKFEGCAVYVPYFWEQYLNGMANRDNGKVLGFDVTPEDRQLFPELKGRRAVRLVESESGFVYEV